MRCGCLPARRLGSVAMSASSGSSGSGQASRPRCGSGSTSPTTGRPSRAGPPSRPCGRSRETLSAALTTVLRSPEPVRVTVAGRTDAACTRAARSPTSTSTPRPWARCRGAPTGTRVSPSSAVWAASCRLTSWCVRRARRPTGFDARFSARRAALPLPDRRHRCRSVTRCAATTRSGGAGRSTPTRWTRPPGLWSGCATSRRSAGSARVRRRPHAARLLVGAPGRRGAGRHRARRRVLPLDGALARRRRRRRWGRAGGRPDWPRALQERANGLPVSTSCRRTGSASRRSSTRPTPSWRRGRSPPGPVALL